jgi:hypothetical protein
LGLAVDEEGVCGGGVDDCSYEVVLFIGFETA